MEWKESKDAVFFNVERSFVGKKFWRRRASIFLRINEELTSKWKRSIDRDLLMVTGGDVCVFIHRVCVYTYVYLICVNDFVTRDANCLWNQFRDSECVIRWIWNWAVYMYKLFLTSWVELMRPIRINSPLIKFDFKQLSTCCTYLKRLIRKRVSLNSCKQ